MNRHYIDMDEYPRVTALADRDHRSRSARRLRCGHEIAAGQRYREIVTLVDGEFTIEHECNRCHDEWNDAAGLPYLPG